MDFQLAYGTYWQYDDVKPSGLMSSHCQYIQCVQEVGCYNCSVVMDSFNLLP